MCVPAQADFKACTLTISMTAPITRSFLLLQTELNIFFFLTIFCELTREGQKEREVIGTGLLLNTQCNTFDVRNNLVPVWGVPGCVSLIEGPLCCVAGIEDPFYLAVTGAIQQGQTQQIKMPFYI